MAAGQRGSGAAGQRGSGAAGSIYTALMASAGNDVWVIDPWQAHTDAIQNQGFRVEGASGDRTVKNEIDAINGMVPVVAKQEGLSAPYNEVLSHIVRSRESAWAS